MHSGEPEEARSAFESALELDPGLPQAWRDLGGALEILERPEEALRAFEAAVELAPRDPVLLAEKGLAARVHSHEDVDRDFCFLANAGLLVLGNGHFSLCAARVS